MTFGIVSGANSLSVDDFTSMLDQLLLVDTLLLGFAINTMTASALSKDDYMTRDAWSMSIGRAHPDASPGLQSYDVIDLPLHQTAAAAVEALS